MPPCLLRSHVSSGYYGGKSAYKGGAFDSWAASGASSSWGKGAKNKGKMMKGKPGASWQETTYADPWAEAGAQAGGVETAGFSETGRIRAPYQFNKLALRSAADADGSALATYLGMPAGAKQTDKASCPSTTCSRP